MSFGNVTMPRLNLLRDMMYGVFKSNYDCVYTPFAILEAIILILFLTISRKVLKKYAFYIRK